MRFFIAAMLVACSSAQAAEEKCFYVNAAGDRAEVVFVDLEIVRADGAKEHCTSTPLGTGMMQRFASCDTGFEGGFLLAPSTPDGTTNDLLIFQTDIWYRRCE